MRLARVMRSLAMFAISAAVGGCMSGSGALVVRDWETDTRVGDFIDYPEQSDDPAYRVPQVAEAYKDTSTIFGIAISGGGNRSAAAALGQLRALHALGWMADAQYLSVISGGSWAVIPYVFLPERSPEGGTLDDEAFLGSYVPPQKLTKKILQTPSDAILAKSISNSGIVLPFLWNAATLALDETYSRSIGRIFLKPLGLDDPDKLVVQSHAQLEQLNRQNGLSESNALRSTDVYMPRPHRPFLIAGTTLMGQPTLLTLTPPLNREVELNEKVGQLVHQLKEVSGNDDLAIEGSKAETRDVIDKTRAELDAVEEEIAGQQKYFHPFEITPLYSGIRAKTLAGDYNGRVIGGHYVETAGFDAPLSKVQRSEKPYRTVDQGDWLRERFSLSDMVGSSGAAPQETLRGMSLTGLVTGKLGFPEFEYWSIAEDAAAAREYPFGDGGHIDNIGLFPLLARRVTNILVFVNTMNEFEVALADGKKEVAIYNNLSKFFVPGDTKLRRSGRRYRHNIVFEAKAFETLVADFERKKKDGQPLVHCAKEYNLLSNLRHGIADSETSKYKPNICWVYLDNSDKWRAAIPSKKLQVSLKREKGVLGGLTRRYGHFPHYWTFFDEGTKVIDLPPEKVNALAHLTAWTVCDQAAEIAATLRRKSASCGE